MIEQLLADGTTDRSPTDPVDFAIGLALIAAAIAIIMIGRSAKARASVGRATGRAAIGTVKAASRPIRAIGRRSRSGAIGHWGRSVVGCENRAARAAEAGKNQRSRFWRGLGDAMVGSSRITCHVPGCDWEQDPPRLPDVVAHLRGHRDNDKPDTEQTTEKTSSGDQPAAAATTTQGEPAMAIAAAETIPELAHLLDATLIPQATREADAAESALIRATDQATSLSGSLDNMAALGMPQRTLASLTAAMEAAEAAKQSAATYATKCAETRDALTTARAAIRAQEAVAETAAAAGGAMAAPAYQQ